MMLPLKRCWCCFPISIPADFTVAVIRMNDVGIDIVQKNIVGVNTVEKLRKDNGCRSQHTKIQHI